MSSIKRAVWVAEFESGDRTSTSVLHYGEGDPGISYADFLGYLTGGRHLMRGQCVRLYARNVDVGLDHWGRHDDAHLEALYEDAIRAIGPVELRRASVDPWYLGE